MKNQPKTKYGAALTKYCRMFFTMVSVLLVLPACGQSPQRLSRANSVFGVHFDFHANLTDQVGQSLTEDMVDTFLRTVKPDFIQIDTKGHTGVASYPSKVGRTAGIIKDPIKLFRQVTAKNGVGLYSHYSSIGDKEAVKDHPEWARVGSGGQPSAESASIFSGYVDKLFIPQLKEISNYGVDGFWIDGDNWMLKPDYSPAAMQAYKAATGNDAKTDQKGYLQFTRQAFRKYLNHYVSALHQYNPKLQIGSSWAFAARMPGPVDAPVDFLSGDMSTNDVSDLDYQAYCLASQGKPWDLMSWAVPVDNERYKYSYKSALQMQQQAAIALSIGGAHEIYVPQRRDASIPVDNRLLQMLKAVSDFCHTMKPYSFQAKSIPQIGLLLSASSHYQESDDAFTNSDQGSSMAKNTLDVLLDAQYPVQIIQEYNLASVAASYPVIVIPEWRYISGDVITVLKKYVQNGGKLIIAGPTASKLLADGLPGGKNYDNNAGLSIKSYEYGKGAIVSVVPVVAAGDLKGLLGNIKQAFATIVKRLYPNPLVSIDGGDELHVNAATKNGFTYINLLNTSKIYADGGKLPNAIKSTGPLNITLRLAKKPTAIKLQPDNTPLNFTYVNGAAKFMVPNVILYTVIQVK